MRCAFMVLFLAARIATGEDSAESKKLLKDLEGSYKVTSAEDSGQAFDRCQAVSIKGDKFFLTIKAEDGKLDTIVATLAVDATNKPAHIDLKVDDGPEKGETSLGIVAIDGETIKICANNVDGKTRPTQFKTTMDDGYILITLKKSKE